MPDTTAGDPCWEPPPAPLYTGIAEFNRGAYFECHETLEAIWMREPGPIRRLYQGILQVGVGFYHLRNGNYRGTLNLLGSAVGYLADFAPACLGVDVARLIAEATQVRAAVVALGPAQVRAFDLATLPQVHYDPQVAAQAVAIPAPVAGEVPDPGHW
ncbi:MAG TPA: DUF309 domain-containing protein [Chloroflexia bacterium]|nr:DUF309 domain-containing protein [Chloroflexia bacterium]